MRLEPQKGAASTLVRASVLLSITETSRLSLCLFPGLVLCLCPPYSLNWSALPSSPNTPRLLPPQSLGTQSRR